MEKEKKAGDNVIWRLKQDVSQDVLDLLNAQTNKSLMLEVICEYEIFKNGIRNFEEVFPAKRSESWWRNFLNQESSNVTQNQGNINQSNHSLQSNQRNFEEIQSAATIETTVETYERIPDSTNVSVKQDVVKPAINVEAQSYAVNNSSPNDMDEVLVTDSLSREESQHNEIVEDTPPPKPSSLSEEAKPVKEKKKITDPRIMNAW
ncbi:hypothetical protein MZM54_04470 [[Brevibacterium] frigoritolerans]|nr:hypothetical protein [Peribacillus frigoritolerans]